MTISMGSISLSGTWSNVLQTASLVVLHSGGTLPSRAIIVLGLPEGFQAPIFSFSVQV